MRKRFCALVTVASLAGLLAWTVRKVVERCNYHRGRSPPP